MNQTIRRIGHLLLIVAILPILSGCNNEDDVIDIFVGKTWKLTFIAAEGSYKQYNYWGDQGMNAGNPAFTASMDLLKDEGNFVLNFEGGNLNGTTGGSFSGRASSVSVNGTWNANGESRELTITLTNPPTDKDVLGKAFVSGLQNAIRYEGDNKNLYIYFKDGSTTKYLAFKAR